MTIGYNLTAVGSKTTNKVYPTMTEAMKVLERLLRFVKRHQAYYDGTQSISYMSIDKVEVLENDELNPLSYPVYVCGETLKIRKD